MASMWYYQQGGQRMGPIPAEALKALAAAGQIRPTDPIMRDDMTTWVPANQVRGLFGAAAPNAAAGYAAPASAAYATPAGVAMEEMPAAPAHYPATARASFTSAQKTRRILLIVAAAIIFICFFTPEFYASVAPKTPSPSNAGMGFNRGAGMRTPTPSSEPADSWFFFGWETWWGMVSFFVGIAALGGAITDLATSSVAIMRKIFKWVHLATFSVIALIGLVGTILGVFAVGLQVSAFPGSNIWIPISSAKQEGLSVHCFPITAVLLVAAAVMGAIVALNIVAKDKA